MSVTELFSKELIEINLEVANQQELFDFAFQHLPYLDFVTADFLAMVKERERAYPTGLQTASGAIAIPHTDPNYVKQSFIYVIRLSQGVSFQEMGTELNDQRFVSPKLIFMIGFQQGDLQLEILTSLVHLFSQPEKMAQIMCCQQTEEIYRLLQAFIGTN